MAEIDMAYVSQPVQFPDLAQWSQSGIYFLHLKDEVVYVGQAVNMRSRLAQHIAEGAKYFDAVAFKPCPTKKLNQWERYYIEQFCPKYNKCGIVKMARELREYGMGIESKLPVYRIKPHKAAEMLGISLEQFRSIRPGPKTSRIPRTSIRTLLSHSFWEWAEKHKEQIDALRAQQT